jgi:hypothetical protein
VKSLVVQRLHLFFCEFNINHFSHLLDFISLTKGDRL